VADFYAARDNTMPPLPWPSIAPPITLDNIFIERLWRSLKQEAIYLEEIDDGFHARRVIKDWMAFYNTKRPHSALDRQTPDDAYWAGLEQRHAA
uniref:integrase core domain-containing protein n=1 Tax=uncultured Paraglaciecola sp. TaxID=1765024 RepID=UPI002614FE94